MSDEYIKMVLALDEKLFKEWEWKEGDMFLYKEDESETYSIGYIGTHILSNTKPVGFMDICFDPFEHLMNLRPIPSQEQLQEIILKHWKKNVYAGYTYIELLSEFHIFIFQKCDIKKLRDNQTSSLEMWLMFLENEIYNKTWNGDSGETEE